MTWDQMYVGADSATHATIATASTSDTIVNAVAGKRIRVLSYVILTGTASVVTWKSNTTAISGAMSCATGGGAVAPFSPAGHFQTAIGEALKIDQTVSAMAQGHVTYCLV